MVSVGGGGRGGRPSGASSASSCSLSRRACSPLQTCETWKAKKPRLTAAPMSSGSAVAKRRCCLCPSRINKFSAGHSLLELIELSDGCVAHRICCMYIPEAEGMRARASTVALATQPMRPKVRRKHVASPRLISFTSRSSICTAAIDGSALLRSQILAGSKSYRRRLLHSCAFCKKGGDQKFPVLMCCHEGARACGKGCHVTCGWENGWLSPPHVSTPDELAVNSVSFS